jgi:hypothetical protein
VHYSHVFLLSRSSSKRRRVRLPCAFYALLVAFSFAESISWKLRALPRTLLC